MKKTFIFAIGFAAGVIAKKWFDNNKGAMMDMVETTVKDKVYTEAEKILHTAVYGVPRTNRVQRPKWEHKVDYSTLNDKKKSGRYPWGPIKHSFDFFSLIEATTFLKDLKKVSLASREVTVRDVKVLKGEDFDEIYDDKHGWYNFDSAYIQHVDNCGVYRVVLGPVDF